MDTKQITYLIWMHSEGSCILDQVTQQFNRCISPGSCYVARELFQLYRVYLSSSNPKICLKKCAFPNGLSLPNNVDPASYLFLGFLTSSQIRSYALESLPNATWWICTCNRCTVRCARRDDCTTSGLESHSEKCCRTVRSSFGWAEGKRERGSCNYDERRKFHQAMKGKRWERTSPWVSHA